MSFAGRRAWVTGGRRGLGRAIAGELARLGCELVITTRDPAASDVGPCLAELQAAGSPLARAVAWELSPELGALRAELRAAPPAILVHAAHAFAPHRPIVALKPAELVESLSRNLGGCYALCREAARLMARTGGGRILLLGSLVSRVGGGVGQASYIAEKAAFDGLARAFAVEFAARDVLVNVIHPGLVDTENVRERVDPRVQAAFAARTAARRLLRPDEVARAALPFCDPGQSVHTGQSVTLGGGAELGLLPGEPE